MTATVGVGSAERSATPPDMRRATRLLAAVVIPAGPAAVAILRYVLPYQTKDSATAAVAAIRAETGTQSAVVWLGLVAILTLVPGVLWVGRLTRRRAPRLTARVRPERGVNMGSNFIQWSTVFSTAPPKITSTVAQINGTAERSTSAIATPWVCRKFRLRGTR